MSGPAMSFLKSRAVTQIVGGKTRATVAARAQLAAGQLDHLHETPAETVGKLLTAEAFAGPIGELACGRLAIARAFAAAGHKVIARDVVDYKLKPAAIPAGVTLLPPGDFLTSRGLPRGVRQLVFNPPFDNQGGERFTETALQLLGRLAPDRARPRKLHLLHKARFLETSKRRDFFDDPAFVRAYFLIERQPMMHRAGHDGARQEKSTEFYAWFVWDLDNLRAPGRSWEGFLV